MGRFEAQRGDPETKLFYIVDQLIGGINTDFSDDTSPDNELRNIVNFNMDRRGSLYKRMGFGKLDALSQIFNLFERLPEVKGKTPENPNPEESNDNIVYAKLLENDNMVFRNLSAFSGDKAYRDYQRLYGFQNNKWSLLMVTTSKLTKTSTAWLFNCTLPPLDYGESGEELPEDTIVVDSQVYDLPVLFNWDGNIGNIETIEFSDKIYMTSNDKGLVCFDRTKKEFTYSGSNIAAQENQAYKPTAMDIRKIGFNVLGDDPLYWVDYQGINTNSIQGMYITSMEDIPLNYVPNNGKFRINILYTGTNSGFDITFKSGENNITADVALSADKSKDGLKVYDVTLKNVPTLEVEIKIALKEVQIDPYYDYYPVQEIDKEAKPIKSLNVGEFGICEMYNRTVYYKDDTLWFSAINNFSYVPNYNYITLPIEPTDAITKVTFFRNVYIIFTKNRIYKMIGSFGDSNFSVTPVNLSVGCHAPNTVVPIENELYFASKRGLYALKSSEFVDGIENLKELDTKVKSLTADRTMYIGELQQSAIRYNGISEKAFALRYKDKYMLFLNSYFGEDGDYAPVSNIDVLVYQYELKAFSSIRFPIKPTFLFIVENHILNYSTVPEKEDYTEEELLLSYDFENTEIKNGKIVDKSENNLDASVYGNLVSAPGRGVTTDGNNSYIKIPDMNVDLASGFNFRLNGDLNDISNVKLFQFKQKVPTGSSKPQSFNFYTNWSNGYRGELICNTVPNEATQENTVNYIFKLHRSSTSITAKKNGAFSLVDESGNALINYTAYNFDFGNNTSVVIKSGSFKVKHDTNGDYSKTWTLTVDGYYPTYSTGWDKGNDVTLDKTQPSTITSLNKSFGIRFQCRTEVYNGGCSVFVKPAFAVLEQGSIAIASRTMYITVNGVKKSCTIPKANGHGPLYFWGNELEFDVKYNGTKTVSVDGQFNIRATLAGVYRENIDVDAFNLTLPKSQSYTITNWVKFATRGSSKVTLNTILKPSYREVSATIVDSHNVKVVCNSEYAERTKIITNNDIDLNNVNDYYVKITRRTSNYLIEILVDNNSFGSSELNLYSIVNSVRNDNYILYNTKGILKSVELKLNNDSNVLVYNFDEGRGTTLNDYSGNKRNGTIVGDITWITEKGLLFDGKSGYLVLPTIGSSAAFSNGYTIEFEGKFYDIDHVCRVLDLATGYGITSSDNRCSININANVLKSLINFESYSTVGKSYKLSSSDIDLKVRHKWKYSVTDNSKEYDVALYCDDELVTQTKFNYGGITNIARRSNYIGKSNKPDEGLFKGMLYNLSIKINASSQPVPIYVCSMYEYDTTYDDFGRPMDIELETKGINLSHPMHIKKLKSVFIKGVGGYEYNSFFFELYCDGHLINDPRVYQCYVDEKTRQVVYEYTNIRALEFNEKVALLGTMRLDKTRLGETTYETKKMVVPAKGKNFTIKIYGESGDFLSIESFGFLHKLGKVKEG